MTQEELTIIFDTHKGMFDFFENNVQKESITKDLSMK